MRDNKSITKSAYMYYRSSAEQRLRVRILCCLVKPWASCFSLHGSSSLNCMKQYLVIDSGGYVCSNTLCPVIAVWQGASQTSRNYVRLNWSAKKSRVNNFTQSPGSDIALCNGHIPIRILRTLVSA